MKYRAHIAQNAREFFEELMDGENAKLGKRDKRKGKEDARMDTRDKRRRK